MREEEEEEEEKEKKLVSIHTGLHKLLHNGAQEWSRVEKGIDRGPPRFYDRSTDKYRSFICR